MTIFSNFDYNCFLIFMSRHLLQCDQALCFSCWGTKKYDLFNLPIMFHIKHDFVGGGALGGALALCGGGGTTPQPLPPPPPRYAPGAQEPVCIHINC